MRNVIDRPRRTYRRARRHQRRRGGGAFRGGAAHSNRCEGNAATTATATATCREILRSGAVDDGEEDAY
jgi:hypothetical protein